MNLKYISFIVSTASVLAGASAEGYGVTAVSNLDNPDPSPTYVGLGTNPYAVSFTTGPAPATLVSVGARVFAGETNIQFPNRFFASIRSDVGGAPGSVLEDRPIDVFPFGDYVLTFLSPGLPLAANTTYWFTLGSPSFPANWYATNLTSEISPFGWTIGNATYFQDPVGGAWFPIHNGPSNPLPIGRLSVDATILPEPVAILFVMAPAMLRRSRPRGVKGNGNGRVCSGGVTRTH